MKCINVHTYGARSSGHEAGVVSIDYTDFGM